MRGAPLRSERSPMTTTSACDARRAQSSGPMPAGSPEVSAMRSLALVKAQLDVGRIAQLAQPLLIGLVGLAVAQRVARLHALSLRGDVARAALERLDEVVAERRAHRLAHLADLQLLVGALELRHRVAGIDPVELATARRRAVVGIGARELGEIGVAVDEAIAQIHQLAPRLALRYRVVRTDEDVAQPRLAHRRLDASAAALDELEEVEAGRAPQRLAYLSRLHFQQHLGEELGQPVLAAPAEHTALQRIGSVGVARRDASKRRAALDLAQGLVGTLARLADALGTRALGHAHEDVGDVEFRVVGARL